MSYHQCESCGSGHVCNTGECQHACHQVPCETPDETDILKRERDNANFQWSYMVQEISKAVGVPCVTPASAVDLVRNLAVCAEVCNRELRETRDAILAEGMEYREDDGPAPYWRNRRALEAEQKMREYQKKIKELELKVRTLRMLRAGEQPMRGPEEGE